MMQKTIVISLISFFGFLGSIAFSQGSWEVFTKEDGLESNAVTQVHVDKTGQIWCVTTVHGVMKFDGENWTIYSKETGLPSDRIFSIAEDHDGNIWFGTFRGVVEYIIPENL